jgi:hypothetical protein
MSAKRNMINRVVGEVSTKEDAQEVVIPTLATLERYAAYKVRS